MSPHKVDAFLKREAEVGSADAPYRNAVVTEVGKNGLKVRTGWETGDVPAKALQIGYETVRGDASTGWLRIGVLLIAAAAFTGLLVNRTLPG